MGERKMNEKDWPDTGFLRQIEALEKIAQLLEKIYNSL